MIRSSLQAIGRQALTKSNKNLSVATISFVPKYLCQSCHKFQFLQFSTLPDDISQSSSVTLNEAKEYMTKHEISVSDPSAPPPVLSFESSGLPDFILSKLLNDFSAPTPIQAQALPIAMSGSNMVGIGQTGSGKTLAFLLPAFLHIMREREKLKDQGRRGNTGPLALVLAPTRELAKQIEEVALQFRRLVGIRTVCCIGGEGRGRQLGQYDKGVDLMIATPGRINDFIESGDMTLDNVGFVVMDEADRMLDMGFEPQVRSVLQAIKEDKQTLMFSATWPEEVQDLASEFLEKYTFMNIGSVELSANKNIHQEVVVTTKDYKQENFLNDMEDKMADKKVLVFTERKATVDRLERFMRNRRMRAMGIHGDKSQLARSNTIQRFRDGTCKVMIATDVAARGLDISNVDWVVNYDFPLDIENYIHRIGRTGRASKKGNSLTYMTSEDARFAEKLIKILQEAGQEIPEDLLQLQRENRNMKAVKGKLGKKRDQGMYRQRTYQYRGVGRDDGDHWGGDVFKNRNRGGFGGGDRWGRRDVGRGGRNTDHQGFEYDRSSRRRGPGRDYDDDF